ncbi:hypothetical protein CEXT_358561 [Caerostris extrusa]|uniref:Uncharacterized protein n=1 Tax=Caerostris extrusa TaxID=172846 RepID=A0AAV4XAE6_CAEEX|nr:hypothetical protein CEXT_358561 [Caerostris extrusa]
MEALIFYSPNPLLIKTFHSLNREASSYLKDKNIALFKPSSNILPSKRPEIQAGGELLQSTNGTMEIPNRAHQFNDDGREQRSLRFRTKHSFPK